MATHGESWHVNTKVTSFEWKHSNIFVFPPAGVLFWEMCVWLCMLTIHDKFWSWSFQTLIKAKIVIVMLRGVTSRYSRRHAHRRTYSMFIQAHKYKHIYASISEKRGRENERERGIDSSVWCELPRHLQIKEVGWPSFWLKGRQQIRNTMTTSIIIVCPDSHAHQEQCLRCYLLAFLVLAACPQRCCFCMYAARVVLHARDLQACLANNLPYELRHSLHFFKFM